MPVTISGSTGISGVDGSAGTPALIGSDADTGIFLAAGQVSASVNGTAGNVPLVSGTSQASTSGTSIDFTSIPSWVKRITVMFNGVSTNGTSNLQIQLGTGATPTYTVTGYLGSLGATVQGGTTQSGSQNDTGFLISNAGAAAAVHHGIIHIANLSSNTWCEQGILGQSNSTRINYSGGSISLAAALTAIRVTTFNGTDTFDAGSINIMYE